MNLRHHAINRRGRGWRRALAPGRDSAVNANEPLPALRGHRLAAARTIWVVVVLAALAVFAAGLPAYYDQIVQAAAANTSRGAGLRDNLGSLGLSVGFYAGWFGVVIPVVMAAAFSLVAAVIFWRRSDEPMALFVSLLLALFGATRSDANEALAQVHSGLGPLSSALESLSVVSVFAFLFVFPNGRFVPRWTRWLVVPAAAYSLLTSVVPDSSLDPKHWSGLPYTAFFGVWFLGGAVAQVYRYRRVSGPVERQQTKWVFAGFTAALAAYLGMILLFFIVLTPPEPGTLPDFVLGTVFYCSTLFIPISIGVAILRYRLWDIDVIINRALVYGALTAIILALYALVVGGLGLFLQGRGNTLASLLAVGLVAVIFAPLRNRLQRAVNRLMYGERDDPYAVLSRLGRRLDAALEPGMVLPTIVETVAAALRLPYAAIELKSQDGFELAAAHGDPTDEQTFLPLSYGGETVGRLVLAPRAPGEAFSPADRSLLEDLARNAEVAVHAVRLTADLQRSRERLVSAREEERRRLRRDLHDGLGPTLASLGLGIDVTLKILEENPEEAEAILRQLKSQTKDAVVDIRRLVYDLRPPALDDLGLVAAIREQAANQGILASELTSGGARRNSGLVFEIEAPAELPPLSAAVEVACYRIVQEAITNIVRHARASNCRVRITVDKSIRMLEIEVSDDGIGMPEDRRAGVGLSSMSERAEELGGRLLVEPAPGGGTRVLARLPLLTKEDG
ncbi:MAG TPA: ATP-binding protein [Rubrobacteraceae bacterium]|nr:ATP-binding protein [Rubrobacteraceae bacterium]